ncbi:MAG: serine O-acetyltransferase, partial [Rhodospirillales bacterium]|nr:serine O-acetyltransferase [Rhodospirillales bacterium]
MVGIPARMVMHRADRENEQEFRAYGTPASGETPDPVARGFDNLRAQITTLTERIEELESRLAQAERGSDASLQPNNDQ